MISTIDTYIRKNELSKHWRLQGILCQKELACAVVIPAFSEYDFIFDTLFSLSASSRDSVSKTQVIVVVNNRLSATRDDKENNARTLALLENLAASNCCTPLSIAWIDASTSGKELPETDGVGLARRIGSDHGLRLLADHKKYDAPIIHLDADTIPSPGYLDAVIQFYTSKARWGGYAAYQHPVDNSNVEHGSNIIAYETYMRYHELALRYAGSPYAYPALGSIMSSTARAYAAAGGMNRRLAGEDFYFLQQLRKTGTLDCIPNALVYPACRSSHRTPFGTGRSISASSVVGIPYAFLFHPECYTILRGLILSLNTLLLLEGNDILDATNAIHPELKHFLKQKRFATHWDKIAANHPSVEARILQFHIWFDGLRTIQLIHHLRDKAFPNILAEDALHRLFSWYATSMPTGNPIMCLRELRRLCRSTCAGSPDFIE